MKSIFNYFLVIGLVFVLAASFHLDDLWAPGELPEATDPVSIELRRDLEAAKICREAHGEAGFTWAEDGRLVCLPRRGPGVITAFE